jgi:hypothetical protein
VEANLDKILSSKQTINKAAQTGLNQESKIAIKNTDQNDRPGIISQKRSVVVRFRNI